MPVGETLEIIAGVDQRIQQVVYPDGLGAAFAGFAGNEPLTAYLWPGEDQPPISPGPTAAWLNAPAGQYLLSFPASATAGLLPETYRLQVTALFAGLTLPLFNGRLRVLSSPGAAAALPVYCTFRDMKRQFAQVDTLIDPEADMAGFGDERAQARQWLDRLAQRHYRTSVAVDPSRFAYFGDGLGIYRTGRDSQWLQAQLDANYLMLTSDVVNCVACYALSQVLGSQVEKDKAGFYQDQGRRFAVRADAMASMLNLQLDLNGDGVADVVIPLGVHDRLEG